MRGFTIDRRVQKKAEGFQLREAQSLYKAFFDTEPKIADKIIDDRGNERLRVISVQ